MQCVLIPCHRVFEERLNATWQMKAEIQTVRS